MRRFGALLYRELVAYFNSPVAYVSLTAFLFLSGLSFALNMFAYAARGVPASYYDTMHVVSFLTMLLAPLITMRLLAEEKNRGTIETLMTAPVRDLEVVLAKFASALVFFGFLLAPTLVLVAVLARFGAADGGAIFTAYAGMFLMASALFAIGMFISALSNSQMVAGFVTLVLALLLTFLQLATYVVRNDDALWRIVAQQINLVENSLPFLQGILDSRPLVYFLSVTALFLCATAGVLGARRWVDARRSLPVFLLTLSLLAANLVVVNRISFRNFFRIDMTASKKFALEPRTVQLLRELPETVHIYGNPLEAYGGYVPDSTIPPAWQRFRELAEEFKRYTDKIRYTEINPTTEMTTLRKLRDTFQEFEANTIYLVSGEEESLKKAKLRLAEVYQGDPSTGKIHRFFGEQRLYSVLTGMLKREKIRILATDGHGELNPRDATDFGFGLMRQQLETHLNAEVLQVNLMQVPQIPGDVNLVLILGPRQPFRREEIERLHDYLDRNGRAFIALAPETVSGLEEYLEAAWGIQVDRGLVEHPQIRERYVPVNIFLPHPVNHGIQLLNFPAPCVVQAEMNPRDRPDLSALPLFYSGPGTVQWTEKPDRSGRRVRQQIKPDGQQGFPLAAVAERKVDEERKGRLIVWGSAHAVWSGWVAYERTTGGYFLNTVSWLTEKEDKIVEVKTIEEEPFKPTPGERTAILVISLGALPFLGIVLGVIAWFYRRK